MARNCVARLALAWLLGLSSIGASGAVAAAQDSCGGIRGRATDERGGVISRVNIRFDERRTKQKTNTETDGHGEYSVCLAPGTYDVTASAQGLKTAKRKQIVVGADAKATIDFVLKLGVFPVE